MYLNLKTCCLILWTEVNSTTRVRLIPPPLNIQNKLRYREIDLASEGWSRLHYWSGTKEKWWSSTDSTWMPAVRTQKETASLTHTMPSKSREPVTHQRFINAHYLALHVYIHNSSDTTNRMKWNVSSHNFHYHKRLLFFIQHFL